MGVRIFLSNGSGNKEIENSQQRIQMVLTTRAIQFITIDISAPGMQEMRSFMREKGRKREGQRNVLPPQIFNGEECRGDYEGFDIANEDDDLEEFLGIPRKNPKAEPVKTGAIAPDVGKLNPGKLLQDESAGGNEVKQAREDEINEGTGDEIKESTGDEVKEATGMDKPSENADDEISKENASENEDHDISAVNVIIENSPAREDDTEEDNVDTDNTESQTSENHEELFKDWKQTVEEEALQNAVDKASEKTDGLAGKSKDNEPKLDTMKDFDIIEDSSDESSDEDSAVEYMPDGELVRKKSRGFKQLNNCKRFWKASLMVE